MEMKLFSSLIPTFSPLKLSRTSALPTDPTNRDSQRGKFNFDSNGDNPFLFYIVETKCGKLNDFFF